MSRAALILVLLAGVTATADAKPHKRRGKVTKKERKDSRVPTKSTKANMPRGFAWPPTKGMVAMGEQCLAKLDEIGIAVTADKPAGHVVTPVIPEAEINGVAFTAVYSKHQVFDWSSPFFCVIA